MRELGEISEEAHRAAGQKVAETRMDVLVVIGKAAQSILKGARLGACAPSRMEFFPEPQEARDFLKKFTRSGDIVLLKASRGARLERVLEDWN
jgi:UDP-N-acetylmuramoyl-tripeptide--D-alanyl-D-alanine ligase